MPIPSPCTSRRRPLADRPWVSTLVGGLLSLTLAGSVVGLALVLGATPPLLGGDPAGAPLRSDSRAAPVRATGGPSSDGSEAGTAPGDVAKPEIEPGEEPVGTTGAPGTGAVERADQVTQGLENGDDPPPPADAAEESVDQTEIQDTSPPVEPAADPVGRTSELTKKENPKPDQEKSDGHPSTGRSKAKTGKGDDKPPKPHPGGGPPGGEPPGRRSATDGS